MRAACRPLCAAVCLLTALLTGTSGLAQQQVPQFLAQDIIQANAPLDAQQQQKLAAFVNGHTQAMLNGDPKEIADARTALVRPFTTLGATNIFKQAISPLIADQLAPALAKDDELLRMNAMVVASYLVGERVVPLIDAGLADPSPAVHYWAVCALRERCRWVTAQAAGNNPPQSINQTITNLIKKVVDLLDQNPDVREVKVELDALLILNTAEARAALVGQLNNRVSLHEQEPNLPWIGEQAVMQEFAQQAVAQSRNIDQVTVTGVCRAAYRSAMLIATQMDGGKIDDQTGEAAIMLGQALQTLAQLGALNGKNAPASPTQVNGWIANGNWDNVLNLLNTGWKPILMADPFNLPAAELE